MQNAILAVALFSASLVVSVSARADEKRLSESLPGGSLLVLNKDIDLSPYKGSAIIFQDGKLMPPGTPYPVKMEKGVYKGVTPACELRPSLAPADGKYKAHSVYEAGKVTDSTLGDKFGTGNLIIADQIAYIKCFSAEGDRTYGLDDFKKAMGDYFTAFPVSEVPEALKKGLIPKKGDGTVKVEDGTARPKDAPKNAAPGTAPKSKPGATKQGV